MRTRTVFFCTDCGNETSRWAGQCPACGAWNTISEQPVSPATSGRRRGATGPAMAEPVRLGDVTGGGPASRFATDLAEFDFVLGGGIMPGSIVLVGGDPGIGKSTLLLQVAARVEGAGRRALYISGEESPGQVRMRGERLLEDTGPVSFLAATDLDAILSMPVEASPSVLIVDSVQTMRTAEIDAPAGSVSQVRECAARLQVWAKSRDTAVFLVGHVTKDGTVAGPKTLEHIVDTVLYFESAPGMDHRILRATKNRFGGVDEIGIFHMTGTGLVPSPDASALFLAGRRSGVAGTAVAAAVEGSRPVLVEVQALCTRTSYGAPQRVVNGFDRQRLALLLAVLEKRAGVGFGTLDVFVNIAGGARLSEPAADLAVAVALASSAMDRPVSDRAAFAGEIGLGGEIRPVGLAERRLAEAARLGFTEAFVPDGTRSTRAIAVRACSDLAGVIAEALP